MGYRSNVAFEINGPAEVILAGLATLRLRETPENWENMKFFQYKREENRVSLVFHVTDWKWYPDYADVQFIKNVYDYFKGLENPETWGHFIRTGEDTEDIEEHHFGDFQWDGVIELVPATIYISVDGYSHKIPRIDLGSTT